MDAKKAEEILGQKRKVYSLFCSELEKYKIFFCSDDSKIASDIKLLRIKLFSFFNGHTLSICRSCKKQCCQGAVAIPVDFRYWAKINLTPFDPDWDFLQEQLINGYPACYFLNKEGCSLKENKPSICIRYLCSEFSGKLTFKNLSDVNNLISKLELAENSLKKIVPVC